MNPGEQELKSAGELATKGDYESALLSYQKARDFFLTSSRRDLYFQSIARIADTYVRMTRFESADSLLRDLEARVGAELGERHKVLADVYRIAGYLRAYQDRYAESIGYNTRGLAIWQDLFPLDSLTHASFQFGLGIAYLRKGEAGSATEWLSRARQAQVRYGRLAGSALFSTLLALGQSEDVKGNLAGSIAMFEQALQLLDTLGMGASSGAVIGRHHLAVALRKSGRLEESLAWERSALEIGRRIYGAKHLSLAGILAQLGDYSVLNGDIDAAIPYYGEARAMFMDLLGPNHSNTYEVERKQARLYLVRGEPDTAVILYRRVIESHTKSFGAANPELASLFTEAGEASLASGDARGALLLYRRARGILPAADRMGRAEACLGEAKAFSALGSQDSAESLLRRSLDLQGSAGAVNPDLRSASFEAIGNLREQGGNLVDARAMYDSALAALGFERDAGRNGKVGRHLPSSARRQAVRVLIAKAGLLMKDTGPATRDVRPMREALALYEAACAMIAQGRESYRSEGSKFSAQSELGEVCAEGFALAETLWKRTGDPADRESALAFAEQSRAGMLLESLERSGRGIGSSLNADPLTRGNALRIKAAQVDRLVDWTARFGPKESLPGLRKELLALYNAIDAIEDSLARAHDGQPDLFPLVRIARLAALQSSLDPGSCMIEYARGPDRLSALVIGRDRFDLVSLGRAAAADSLAGALRRALRSLDRHGVLSSARALYRRIILPFESSIRGYRHLVIVPAGGLSYVPFEALIAPDAVRRPGTAVNGHLRTPRYLVRDFDISYSLSGTFYCRSRGEPGTESHRGMTFAGFAPVFRSGNAAGNEKQHQYIAQLDPLATRSITVDGKVFTELPWSADEIREIGGMFDAGGDTSVCLYDGNATEDRFKAGVDGADMIHVATHGFINDEHPSLSALLFAPARDSASADDGVLYAGEVYDLRLRADLVVLSSCESGVGRMAPGEGLLAMSRGFLAAGARTIAYSLWKVNDRLTGVLMQKFYRSILRGEGYASALSAAKRAMILDPATANPYFWAGFVLLGK